MNKQLAWSDKAENKLELLVGFQARMKNEYAGKGLSFVGRKGLVEDTLDGTNREERDSCHSCFQNFQWESNLF